MAPGEKLAEAYVQIGTKLDALSAGLAKAESMVKSTMSRIGAMVAGIGAGVGIGGMIKIADDLSKSYNYAGLVFGDFAKIVIGESDRVSSKFGASRRELVQGATEIGEVFRRAGAAPSLAARLTSQLIPMATAIARVRDINMPEALKAIEYGLEGSTRGLRRMGLTIRDEQVEMEAFRLGMVKLGGSFSESDLTIARASLLMRMMSETTKVLENSNISLSSKTSAAWAKIRHAFEDVGTAFLPLAHRIIDNVNGIAERISAWVARHKSDLDYFVSSTQWAFDQIRDGLSNLYNDFVKYLSGKGLDFSSLQSALVTVSVTVRGFFEDFGTYAKIAELKFVEMAYHLQDTFNWLKGVVSSFTDWFAEKWESGVLGALRATGQFFYQWYKDAQKGAAALGDIVGSALAGGKPLPAGAASGAAPVATALAPAELKFRDLGDRISELNKQLAENSKKRAEEIEERKKPFVGPPKPEEVKAVEERKKALSYPPALRKPNSAEFVGLADFWKKIQVGVLSTQPNYQQQIAAWTQRTAVAAEKLAEQGNQKQVAVAEGPS